VRQCVCDFAAFLGENQRRYWEKREKTPTMDVDEIKALRSAVAKNTGENTDL
jgi:hypothetical protein